MDRFPAEYLWALGRSSLDVMDTGAPCALDGPVELIRAQLRDCFDFNRTFLRFDLLPADEITWLPDWAR